MIFWIAGLSGAGKTTIGRGLVVRLSCLGTNAILLDGDDLRSALDLNNYSEAARLETGKKYFRLGELIRAQGFNVVIAAGGLSRGLHPWARRQASAYRAVLLDVPLEEVRTRDTKSLYSQADSGKELHLPGVDIDVADSDEFDAIVQWQLGEHPETTVERVLFLWQEFKRIGQ